MADTYINPSGSISVGNTAGSGQSLNILRNFRTSSGVNVNTSVDFLRTFFRDFTQNSSANNRPISFTQFRGGLVFRVDIVQFNECSGRGPYHDRNDGVLQLRVTGGSGGTFNLNGMTGNQTIANGGTALWTNLGGTYGGNTRGDYSLIITDNPTNVYISMTLVRCYEAGYGTSYIEYQSNSYTRFNTQYFNKN